MSKGHCTSCGKMLTIERAIEEMLGGSIEVCLNCIDKALVQLIDKWIDDLHDLEVRRHLKNKLTSTTAMIEP